MPNLETKLYDEKIEQEVFKEILDALTFIEPQFISREKYDKLEGNILQQIEYSESDEKENKKSIDRRDYKLFLPESGLKIDETAGIIGLINKKTFGENLPNFSSVREMQVKIIIAVNKILKLLKSKKDNKVLKKALSRFSNTYRNLGLDIRDLNNKEKKKSILDLFDLEEIKNYKNELVITKTKIKLEENKDLIIDSTENNIDFDEYLNTQLEQHFEENFFERGVNNLRFGLMIMTQGEQTLIQEKYGETIQKRKTLKNKERFLRDEIQVDKYKKELNELRKNGNKEKIVEKELEATNKIIKEIYNNFPYSMSKELYGDSPSKIIQEKELYCTGASIIGHSLLEELGIKHKAMDIPSHSALEINIGDKKYFFDATIPNPKIYEFKYNELDKIGAYKKIVLVNGLKMPYRFSYAYSGRTETLLLSQLYSNLGAKYNLLGQYNKAMKILNKSIKLNNSSIIAYYNLGTNYLSLGDYINAEKKLLIAKRLYDKNLRIYHNLLFLYKTIGDEKKLENHLVEMLEIDGNNRLVYNNLIILYGKKGDINKAKAIFKLAIKKFPKDILYKEELRLYLLELEKK